VKQSNRDREQKTKRCEETQDAFIHRFTGSPAHRFSSER
jgi:hypothetical protein